MWIFLGNKISNNYTVTIIRLRFIYNILLDWSAFCVYVERVVGVVRVCVLFKRNKQKNATFKLQKNKFDLFDVWFWKHANITSSDLKSNTFKTTDSKRLRLHGDQKQSMKPDHKPYCKLIIRSFCFTYYNHRTSGPKHKTNKTRQTNKQKVNCCRLVFKTGKHTTLILSHVTSKSLGLVHWKYTGH